LDASTFCLRISQCTSDFDLILRFICRVKITNCFNGLSRLPVHEDITTLYGKQINPTIIEAYTYTDLYESLHQGRVL